MKSREWQNFFEEQRELHGKMIFSTAELANAAHTTLHIVNTELGRLVKRGLVERYAQGLYGPNRGVTPESVVPTIDPGAYLTGFYALFRHHLVTQAPVEVTCFTNRRHNRRADRATPAGRLRFIRVPDGIYSRPTDGALASPEQALCDLVWLSLRDGVEPVSLVTLRNLQSLNRQRLGRALKRHSESVRAATAGLVGELWSPFGLIPDPTPTR